MLTASNNKGYIAKISVNLFTTLMGQWLIIQLEASVEHTRILLKSDERKQDNLVVL